MRSTVAEHQSQATTVSPGCQLGAAVVADNEQGIHNFQYLVDSFLTYLEQYRQASPLTLQAYGRDLKRLHRFLVSHGLATNVRNITSRELQAFAVSMSGLAPATITRALNATSSLFSYLIRSGLAESNPVDSVIKPKQRPSLPQGPTVQQCHRLVQATSDIRDRVMIMLLLTAGLRRSELLNSRTSDLTADLSRIRIMGKGGKERVIPLPEQTRRILEQYLDERESTSELLFPNTRAKRMGNSTFYRIFKRIVKRAGLDQAGITAHSLRHAYATMLLHSAVDVKTVQELLGHADLSTTSRYLHSDDATKQAAAEALPDLLSANEGQDTLSESHSEEATAVHPKKFPAKNRIKSVFKRL